MSFCAINNIDTLFRTRPKTLMQMKIYFLNKYFRLFLNYLMNSKKCYFVLLNTYKKTKKSTVHFISIRLLVVYFIKIYYNIIKFKSILKNLEIAMENFDYVSIGKKIKKLFSVKFS